MNKYKTLNTTSLFSEDYMLEKLSKQGDPLELFIKLKVTTQVVYNMYFIDYKLIKKLHYFLTKL